MCVYVFVAGQASLRAKYKHDTGRDVGTLGSLGDGDGD